MSLEVSRAVIERMERAAIAAQPEEACAILLGQGNCISALLETRNVHPDPRTHFEIDPHALIRAFKAERSGGLQVIGYFHSHPSGDPSPSATDRAMAAHDGKVWAIFAGGTIAFWRDNKDNFDTLSYAMGTD
ncbi:M67 family metallopeptidase [Erythrobacter insulae]|uniref:M67 family metallopeptidase n=1 Tax=Erythrobacter insulae TaxID=2584124 RepID=A0A547P9H7_9SPHN|nr:M67 family metallopeptidase [Erythrobacter insulae]TRD10808.1 M67 family metallopeptidase [Erythrobacter insulae]